MKYRALSLWIAIGVISVMAASCSKGTTAMPTEPTPAPAPAPAPAPTVTLITVTSGATTGATFQLGAAARLSDGSTIDVTLTAVWDSSDAAVATVAQGGAVTVRTSGTVDLRATYGSMSGSTRVIVTPSPIVITPVPTFALNGIVTTSGSNPQPVAGAQVRLLEPGLSNNPTTTDASGAFTFRGLTAGRHLIEVTKSRYETRETEIVIVDRAVQITMTLELTGVTP